MYEKIGQHSELLSNLPIDFPQVKRKTLEVNEHFLKLNNIERYLIAFLKHHFCQSNLRFPFVGDIFKP